MKKVISMILAVTVLCFFSCGKAPIPSETTPANTEMTPSATEKGGRMKELPAPNELHASETFATRVDYLDDKDGKALSFVKKIESKAELDEFAAFNDSFAHAVDGYDDSFFENEVLLLAYGTTNSGSLLFGVADVTGSADTITLHIEQLNSPEVFTCDMAGWLFGAFLEREIADQYEFFAIS